MRKILVVLLFIFPNIFIRGQEYSDKTVTVGEDIFLPYLKGKVFNRIPKNDTNYQKIFGLLQSAEAVGKTQGYEVEVYSSGENLFGEISFIPYMLEGDKTVRARTASSLKIFFNDIMMLWQPISLDIPNIYYAPIKKGEFMGYTIYEQGGVEKTIIYKSTTPLFLPVSREEYLMALIKSEEEKQKKNGAPISSARMSVEIEKTYQELLKTDKVAAEEFKQQMKGFKNDMAENNATEDLVSLYRKELEKLSPLARKKQAYYAIYAMEKYGNFSGLVPEGEQGKATALVKPNDKAFPMGSRDIYLMVVSWDLITPQQSEKNSPRLYQPQNNFGFSLTDNKMYELYKNQVLWKHIIGLVK